MKTENKDRTLLVTGGGGTGLPQNKPDGFSDIRCPAVHAQSV